MAQFYYKSRPQTSLALLCSPPESLKDRKQGIQQQKMELAIIFALRKLRSYLDGGNLEFMADHMSRVSTKVIT